jgi:toxin CptA
MLAAVGWHGDDRWMLALPGDTEVEGRLRAGRVLGPLIVLRLAWAPRGRAALALLPDNLDADTRRRLRMRLSASADRT